ncbi:MAG: hypothetical protein ABFS56_19475 [Pseudomonadota bacterium]
MAYEYKEKSAGDLIESKDWNEMGKELQRLGEKKAREIKSATDEISTDATEWEDMPDMAIEISTNDNPVLVLFNAGGVQPASQQRGITSQFRLLIDDEQKAYTLHEYQYGGTQSRDVMLNWMGTLSKGTHTIQVQWRVEENQEIKACYKNANRNLMAVEL